MEIKKTKNESQYIYTVTGVLPNNKPFTLELLRANKEYSRYYGQNVYRDDNSPKVFFTLAECLDYCNQTKADKIQRYFDTVIPARLCKHITQEQVKRAENRIRELRKQVFSVDDTKEILLHKHISILSQFIAFYR